MQLFPNPPIFVIKLCLCCGSVLLIECHLRSQLKGPLTLMRSCAEQIVVKEFGWFASIIRSTNQKKRFYIFEFFFIYAWRISIRKVKTIFKTLYTYYLLWIADRVKEFLLFNLLKSLKLETYIRNAMLHTMFQSCTFHWSW